MNKSENNVMKTGSVIAVVVLVLLVVAYSFWRIVIEEVDALNGTRFMPPKIMSDMVLVNEKNQALPANLLKGKWSFIMFAETTCGELCKQQLDVTGQVVATGPDEIQRLLVLAHEPTDEFIRHTRDKHPDLVIAVLTRPIWTIFIVQFMTAIDEIGGKPFFLINPNGLLVMGYDELVPVKEVKEDVSQLMSN